jgi:hypothetical protein
MWNLALSRWGRMLKFGILFYIVTIINISIQSCACTMMWVPFADGLGGTETV